VRRYKTVNKKWGYETWFENNDLYCGKKLVCRDQVWSSDGWYHYHPKKDETFFVIEGSLVLDIEGRSSVLTEGVARRIPPNTRHRFRSLGKEECVFIEVSTTHCDTDSIRVKTLEEGRDE
jgi:mannose-6-phosphate isomerase-like protein (cupin superfamily)